MILCQIDILLAPQIPFLVPDDIDRTSFLKNNISMVLVSNYTFIFRMHQIMLVYILNLFVLVWIHSSGHLITIQISTMHFGQLLNFSILSVYMHFCFATSKHIAITVNVWGLNEFNEMYKSIYFRQSSIYSLAGLCYWCLALALFSLNWWRLSLVNINGSETYD